MAYQRAFDTMSQRTSASRGATFVLALGMAFAALGATPAAAQTDPPPATAQQIDARPKGTIGGALIGAELGFMFPALLGRAVPALHDTWSFIVFPTVFAGGGAVAGWFLLDDPNRPEAAVGVLAFGLALVVPTLVVTLVSTAYDPDRDIEPPSNPPAPDEAAEGEPAEAAHVPREAVDERVVAMRAGTGLLRLQGGALRLGLPGVSVVPRYSPQQLALYGGEQDHEIRLSLFSGAF
ncbi:MAG: hypothetical protein AAGH15_09535 [Myxococcota bacterium]